MLHAYVFGSTKPDGPATGVRVPKSIGFTEKLGSQAAGAAATFARIWNEVLIVAAFATSAVLVTMGMIRALADNATKSLFIDNSL
jgi:hypothetical protein